jgi:hypothetical protein
MKDIDPQDLARRHMRWWAAAWIRTDYMVPGA